MKNLAKVYSAELEGVRARLIEVEVDVNAGLHAFHIVGLADKALNEARERVNSALKNSGVKPPNRENRKITVNLAPADIKKTGSQYDLAIATGYLLATKQIKEFDPGGKIFAGELALTGEVRPVTGALNIAQMAAARGFTHFFVSPKNASEASAIPNIKIIPVQNLEQMIGYLENRAVIKPVKFDNRNSPPASAPDLSEIKGQEHAKRCLMIAAAGGHNLLMIGPPGVGKSFLAQALAGILPPLTHAEAIEITKIWSAAGMNPEGIIRERVVRSPHQTASLAAVIGGGTNPKPGEISLAHRGILFLDELPEFPKNILESLRAPMESGTVHVSRARGSLSFPAKFTLIAAMNPCPCGYHGDPEKECRCGAHEVLRYRKKISGPLMDRIDMQIHVGRVKIADLRERRATENTSPQAKAAVQTARESQIKRFKNLKIQTNAEMSSKDAQTHIKLAASAEKFMETLDREHLSPRSFYRLLKTAQTIADLETEPEVKDKHLAEAWGYRLKDEV